MKENLSNAILKIASFIGHEMYALPLLKDRSKLDFLVDYCSFDQLKHVVNKMWTDTFSMTPEEVMKSDMPDALKDVHLRWGPESANEEKEPYVICRKGVIGDWRNHFSEEQSKRMDEKFAQKVKDIDLLNLWKKYM